jgi:hypothetical protein
MIIIERAKAIINQSPFCGGKQLLKLNIFIT